MIHEDGMLDADPNYRPTPPGAVSKATSKGISIIKTGFRLVKYVLDEMIIQSNKDIRKRGDEAKQYVADKKGRAEAEVIIKHAEKIKAEEVTKAKLHETMKEHVTREDIPTIK